MHCWHFGFCCWTWLPSFEEAKREDFVAGPRIFCGHADTIKPSAQSRFGVLVHSDKQIHSPVHSFIYVYYVVYTLVLNT
jgi:hypothetical protein